MYIIEIPFLAFCFCFPYLHQFWASSEHLSKVSESKISCCFRDELSKLVLLHLQVASCWCYEGIWCLFGFLFCPPSFIMKWSDPNSSLKSKSKSQKVPFQQRTLLYFLPPLLDIMDNLNLIFLANAQKTSMIDYWSLAER